MKQEKISRREKLIVEFAILSFLFFFLVIFAPIGAYLNIYFALNAKLPENISSTEYFLLTFAMILVIPVFVSSRRKLVQFKELNELSKSREDK